LGFRNFKSNYHNDADGTQRCSLSGFRFASTNGDHTGDGGLKLPTDRQMDVLHAAQMREAGCNWEIQRSDGLDCIDCGWLTDDYYLTDVAKRLLQRIERQSR
jgi:hypothetical protein